MATHEHIGLSDFIKTVHQKLREDAKISGPAAAWKNHLNNEDNLRKYAENMRKLATEHWQINSSKDSKAVSRINWVYEVSRTYFFEIYKFREKEHNMLAKIEKEKKPNVPSHEFNQDKLRLLDVGSCYNPFKEFSCFEVTAVDIAPACTNVLKCDFLNIPITDKHIVTENRAENILAEIQESSYDIVVFSLLLEYLPDTKQRQLCCEKAYNLLKPEGILAIITPDSKHVGANAKLMKSWRFVMAKMGFMRIKYEKLPYIHCMVFRKALSKELAQRWARIHADSGLYEEILIPQDFNSTREEENRCNEDDKDLEGERWSSTTFLDNIDINSD